MVTRRGVTMCAWGWTIVFVLGTGATSGRGDLAAAAPGFPRWLAGCWSGARGPEQFRERWILADDETLLGVGYTRAGASLQSFEFLRIVTRGQNLAYIAQPEGSPPTEFASSRATANEVVFENPDHDYPKRISYRRLDVNRVAATVDDGSETGQRLELSLTRDLCS